MFDLIEYACSIYFMYINRNIFKSLQKIKKLQDSIAENSLNLTLFCDENLFSVKIL